MSNSLLLPQLTMASFICHRPLLRHPPPSSHPRHLCLTCLRCRAETTPVTFAFISSVTYLPPNPFRLQPWKLHQQFNFLSAAGFLSFNDLTIGLTWKRSCAAPAWLQKNKKIINFPKHILFLFSEICRQLGCHIKELVIFCNSRERWDGMRH